MFNPNPQVCSIEELEERMGYLDITVDDLLAKSPAFRKALLSMDGYTLPPPPIFPHT